MSSPASRLSTCLFFFLLLVGCSWMKLLSRRPSLVPADPLRPDTNDSVPFMSACSWEHLWTISGAGARGRVLFIYSSSSLHPHPPPD